MSDNNDLQIKLSALDQLTPTLQQAVSQLSKLNDSVSSIAPSAHKTAEATEGMHGGLVSLAAGAELLEVGLEVVKAGFELLSEAVMKSVEAALEGEKSFNALVGALVSTGQFTKEATKSIVEYAEHVQQTTGVNEELVQSHVAIGVQMGLSIQRSEELERASRSLAVMTGGDVDQAFNMLKNTLAGHGRGIQNLIPAMKDFGSAQLQNGAAIDYVNSHLEASAKLAEGSFGASLGKATSAVGSLFKAFGNLIIQNPTFQSAVEKTAMVVGAMTNDLKGNKEATDTLTESTVKSMEAASKRNAVEQQSLATFGEYEVGTRKQRTALAADAQARNEDAAQFKKYYDDKINTLVTKEAEQNQKVRMYRANLTGIYRDQVANEKSIEIVKEQQLKAALNEEIIDEQQYHDAILELQQDLQIKQTELAAQHAQKRVKIADSEGDSWNMMLGQIEESQAKHGKIMGTLQALQASEIYKTENKMLGDLSSLRNSHSQAAFEAGKDAAIAAATVQTFLSATESYAALASIPYVGPYLGAAAAAAAIAAGYVQIQNIESQTGPAGQADQGMDAVPSHLTGKSFILSAGEAVIQPEANKDLRNFLANQKQGNGSFSNGQNGSGNNYNIKIDIAGSADKLVMQEATKQMIDALRKESERGTKILSNKGVY